MKKIIGIITGFLLVFGFVFVIADMLYGATLTYKNKGKRALINDKDTCIILYQDRDGFVIPTPNKKITVLYKNKLGNYDDVDFPEEMITILK